MKSILNGKSLRWASCALGLAYMLGSVDAGAAAPVVRKPATLPPRSADCEYLKGGPLGDSEWELIKADHCVSKCAARLFCASIQDDDPHHNNHDGTKKLQDFTADEKQQRAINVICDATEATARTSARCESANDCKIHFLKDKSRAATLASVDQEGPGYYVPSSGPRKGKKFEARYGASFSDRQADVPVFSLPPAPGTDAEACKVCVSQIRFRPYGSSVTEELPEQVAACHVLRSQGAPPADSCQNANGCFGDQSVEPVLIHSWQILPDTLSDPPPAATNPGARAASVPAPGGAPGP